MRHALNDLEVVAEATSGSWRVRQYENGTIMVSHNDAVLPQAKPALREIAAKLGVPLLNGSGNPANSAWRYSRR